MTTDAQLPWRVPVMQAPIGPAASPELVAAVSAAGGIGCLGASWTEPAALREQIRSIRRSTDRPFCVNLVLAFDQDERLEVVAEEGVALVSFSWGVEAALVARAHAAGCLVLAQVASAGEALAAVRSGCDAVVAQGVEAGGHVQGETGLLALLGEVCRAVDVPVIAAGGIADGDGARAAMTAGAAGMAMGTRFLATPEADVHPEYAERLVAAGPEATVLTHVFDGGWPDAAHRVLRNSTYAAWERQAVPRRASARVRGRRSPRSTASRSPATPPTSPAGRRPATSRRCASTPAAASAWSRPSSPPLSRGRADRARAQAVRSNGQGSTPTANVAPVGELAKATPPAVPRPQTGNAGIGVAASVDRTSARGRGCVVVGVPRQGPDGRHSPAATTTSPSSDRNAENKTSVDGAKPVGSTGAPRTSSR